MVGTQQFQNDLNYQELISRTNIYYLNPISNNQPRQIPISNIDNGFSLKSEDIKIIIHGWKANPNHVSIAPLKYAYLAKGHNGIFIADWKDIGRITYREIKFVIEPLSKRLADLLDKFIRKNNISADKIHIIGHSLGAHIAGKIGEYFNGTIGRITGLDPGKFFQRIIGDGLESKHAKFVDIIHTATPGFSTLQQQGHVDFYPNFGKIPQPGCAKFGLFIAALCSHSRATLLYAESIQLPQNFPSYSCSLQNIINQDCILKNDEDMIKMGENLSNSTRGSYFLRTNDASPFGLGTFSSTYLKYNF
ncbi:pancreatic triacylglycerol lipase-like [Condylostylus longicornis]|uniref:pancreatic triacylglycerol lipase-like n=1 Tax=Condylostylus longicornis TaxID=2530218 RepID=UPI00244E4274|nr:pancreatic triacylglycerol lipase-like [Condylostylus longicornis]